MQVGVIYTGAGKVYHLTGYLCNVETLGYQQPTY